MKKITILFSIIGFSIAFSANSVFEKFNGISYECDLKWHNKDLTGRDLTKEVLRNINVFGSCFSQEKPDSHIFPDDMSGVTFLFCNLDNVFIPPNNEVIQCSQRKFKVQNDLEDWVIDAQLKPVEPLNKETFIAKGISTDPKDISAQKSDRPVTTK